MPALYLVIVAFCVGAIAYRFYSAFIAAKVMVLDDSRTTPAHSKYDGSNYYPTTRWVLFGHHFAAIAGAGPLDVRGSILRGIGFQGCQKDLAFVHRGSLWIAHRCPMVPIPLDFMRKRRRIHASNRRHRLPGRPSGQEKSAARSPCREAGETAS